MNVIFDIIESHAFKNIAHVGSFKHFVIVAGRQKVGSLLGTTGNLTNLPESVFAKFCNTNVNL